MKNLRLAVLYTALALFANAAWASDIAALREGSLQKLNFHAEPVAVPAVSMETREGEVVTLDSYRGKVILLNFWATWCAPCREEMPALDALQAEFGGEDFAVLTVATGRNALPAIDRFYAETGLTALPVLLDPKGAMAREMGVFGLPVSILIDRDGREIGRLIGDAEWHGDSARAIISALLAS